MLAFALSINQPAKNSGTIRWKAPDTPLLPLLRMKVVNTLLLLEGAAASTKRPRAIVTVASPCRKNSQAVQPPPEKLIVLMVSHACPFGPNLSETGSNHIAPLFFRLTY